MKKVVYFSYALFCILLNGCAITPSISVLGAYFPDWLFCIVGAIIATSFIHSLLRAYGLLAHFGPRYLPLAYVSLTSALALGGWLIFFKN
ncbi:MAG: hypothetical protein KBA82_00075 [Nitrosomonas sp.]|nr:hypothetical protein [Nitrosomonas sp.]MBP7111397.1 hypothetical protein [Nitrosomonas sp.]